MRIRRTVVVLVVVGVAVTRALDRQRALARVSRTNDLEYHVRVGEDPAGIVAGLRIAGFPARAEVVGGQRKVVAGCDPTQDRERVRSIVRERVSGPEGEPGPGGAIRFADE